MKTYRVTGRALFTFALLVILSGCFGPLTNSQQSLEIELRSATGRVSAQSLSDGEDGYLFAMVISEEILRDNDGAAATLLEDTETALVEAQESIARGTTPEEFELNLDLEAGEFQSLVVNLADSPSGATQFSDLASGVPYFVVVHVIGTREALIGYGRATLDAGETTTVPITLTDDLSTFETEVASSYGGTIDLSLEYTVSFNTREGDNIEPVILQRGQDIGAAISARQDPTRSPDSFLGWKVGSVSGESVDANTTNPVVQDVELVASWTAQIQLENFMEISLGVFPSTAFYDLLDGGAYDNPSIEFDGFQNGSEFTGWYTQGGPKVQVLDREGQAIEKSGDRSPLGDTDEDGTYEIFGVVPRKEWRILITDWADRSDGPDSQAALFSGDFQLKDGETTIIDALSLESVEWTS